MDSGLNLTVQPKSVLTCMRGLTFSAHRKYEFVSHSYDYVPNWTPLTPITIFNCYYLSQQLTLEEIWVFSLDAVY